MSRLIVARCHWKSLMVDSTNLALAIYNPRIPARTPSLLVDLSVNLWTTPYNYAAWPVFDIAGSGWVTEDRRPRYHESMGAENAIDTFMMSVIPGFAFGRTAVLSSCHAKRGEPSAPLPPTGTTHWPGLRKISIARNCSLDSAPTPRGLLLSRP